MIVYLISILQCYNEYGDIIKTTMGKAREINKINCALTMVLSLVSTYKDIQTANDSVFVSKGSQSFTDLKVSAFESEKYRSKTDSVLFDFNRNWRNDLRYRSDWTP